jgi:uncharacterized phiE125 gp8 family phage protein
MPYTVTGAPATEPLSTAEAKTHLNVTTSDDDTYIGTLIVAAREYVQNRIRRSLITQTIAAYFDRFDGCFELERGPVQSITSISYVDTNGDTQVLASSVYQADLVTVPARIVEAYQQTWPGTRDQLNAVTITYVAGYGAAAAVPQPIKQAMLLYLAHLYENRESVIVGTIVADAPQSVDALLSPYRVW